MSAPYLRTIKIHNSNLYYVDSNTDKQRLIITDENIGDWYFTIDVTFEDQKDRNGYRVSSWSLSSIFSMTAQIFQNFEPELINSIISDFYAYYHILNKFKKFRDTDFYNRILEKTRTLLPEDEDRKITGIKNLNSFKLLQKTFKGEGLSIFDYHTIYKLDEFRTWPEDLQKLCREKLWKFVKEGVEELRSNEVKYDGDDTQLTEAYIIEYYRTYCGCCPGDESYYGPFRSEEDAQRRLKKLLSLNTKEDESKYYQIKKYDIERISGGRIIIADEVIDPEDYTFKFVNVNKDGTTQDYEFGMGDYVGSWA